MIRTARALVIVLAAATSAEAHTWTVGGAGADFPFIAPAIAAATAGDVIEVRAGVYREDLVLDKRLTLVGIGRPLIIGTGIGTVVTIAASQSEVSGFAIEGSGTGESNEMDAGIQISSDANRIDDNILRRVFYGIVVVNAVHNEITGNEIHGLRELPFGRRGDGIYLYRAPENFVARNRVSGERDAIYFQYAPRGRAVDNMAFDSRYALHDMFSDGMLIARNTFAGSAVGANIMNSRRIRFEHNRIRHNRGVPGIGLTLKDCDDSTIADNILAGNARALLLDGSSHNRFAGNTFVGNDTAATVFSSAEQNAFGGNRFIDNWSDVVLSGRDGGTRWSIDGRGNFWSRYRGFDFDGDGIGDAPHRVVGAFERIEGATPAARLFLHSPAAAGLELAARLSATPAADGVDDRPLVAEPPRARAGRAAAAWLLLLGGVAIGMQALHAGERRSRCSR